MLAPDTILQTRYRVVRSIGQGGMGAVYMATDLRLRSTVALKETLFHDEKLRRAFEHEAELLANLHHPALPSVSDHFIEGEGQFLVMQFIQGEDLFELLKEKNGPFPVDEVLNWADQLLDALDYLHTQDPQVIHRDIKPQNLKLTARGQIILLDFGLAKGTPLQVSRVTTSGSIFGYTPNYAPLEQIHGTGTDARSDLYSLAATLYALLTGGPPPDALSRATALVGEQKDPLRPASEINPRVPNAVADVLMRAMTQNKTQRFASANEMRRALKIAQSGVIETAISEARTVLIPVGNQTEQNSGPPVSTQAVAVGGGVPTRATSANSTLIADAASAGPKSDSPAQSRADSEVVTVVRPQAPTPSKGSRLWMVAVPCLLLLLSLGTFGLYKALRHNSEESNQPEQLPNLSATPDTAVIAPQPSRSAAFNDQASAPATPAESAAKPSAAVQTARSTKPSTKQAKPGSVSPEPPPEVPSESTLDQDIQRQVNEALREAEDSRREARQARQAGRKFKGQQGPPFPNGPDEAGIPLRGRNAQGHRQFTQRNPDGSSTTTIVRPGGPTIRYTLNPDGTMRGRPQITPRP
jgi:serine/threonine protein kinase